MNQSFYSLVLCRKQREGVTVTGNKEIMQRLYGYDCCLSLTLGCGVYSLIFTLFVLSTIKSELCDDDDDDVNKSRLCSKEN